MKQKIVIAGLGLIGGSIAKAISKTEKYNVIGFDPNEDAVNYALEHNIIQKVAISFKEGAKEADVIILAAPITETISLMKELNDITFDHPVIVSDTASVKGSIIETANNFTNSQIAFIGGHPMAGSHKTGIHAAKAHLFENAIYVLSPTNDSSDKQLQTLKEVLKGTKSRFIILDPDEHDEMTSVVSHFPHLIASSLVHQAKKWEGTHAYLPSLAAGGFRDITRIASSNPEMWQDIFYHNGHKMSHLLEEWIMEMTTLKGVLENNAKHDMITYLKQAKDYRDGLGSDKRGAMPSFYDLYVDIKDSPGALAKVVQLLADENISITNIRILEIRDNVNGALRLTLSRKETQIKGYHLLKENNYDVVIES